MNGPIRLIAEMFLLPMEHYQKVLKQQALLKVELPLIWFFS